MTLESAVDVLDERDQRLVAALQCDGRLTAERASEVLGVSARIVHKRWKALLSDGMVRVVGSPVPQESSRAVVLRVRVLRGKMDVIVAALAARSDILYIDLSATGDEILAVSVSAPESRNTLLFKQLPATQAVTTVEAATMIHVFSTSRDWRLDVLTDPERKALTPTRPQRGGVQPTDEVGTDILEALHDDARAPAAHVAASTGYPESTVRRRIKELAENGHLRTEVVVDPRSLGLSIDANVLMQVPPAQLDRVGRVLADHPAVHGAFATTGSSNLHVAVWLRDLEELYQFITHEIGDLGATRTETVIVGQAVKRPGGERQVRRTTA